MHIVIDVKNKLRVHPNFLLHKKNSHFTHNTFKTLKTSINIIEMYNR